MRSYILYTGEKALSPMVRPRYSLKWAARFARAEIYNAYLEVERCGERDASAFLLCANGPDDNAYRAFFEEGPRVKLRCYRHRDRQSEREVRLVCLALGGPLFFRWKRGLN